MEGGDPRPSVDEGKVANGLSSMAYTLPQMRKLHDSSIPFEEYNHGACNGIYWSGAAENRFGKVCFVIVPDLEPNCTKAQVRAWQKPSIKEY